MKLTARKKQELERMLLPRRANQVMGECIAKLLREWSQKVERTLFDSVAAHFFPKGPPEFSNGDFVTRDGTDVHQVRNMDDDGFCADFVCVAAPASGWCSVGDIEVNLCRRYAPVDYSAGADTHPAIAASN